jgi:hypothetical protein
MVEANIWHAQQYAVSKWLSYLDGVGSGGHNLHALGDDSRTEDGGSGCAVSGCVVGL